MNPPPLPKPPRRLLPLALVLAFCPAAFCLILVRMQISGVRVGIYCAVAAVLGVVCCTVSSIILFKRHTTTAIVFGVLLAIVNVVISLFLGCASLLADSNPHS
jgi:multidrug transporter EmrE-like cation transporter